MNDALSDARNRMVWAISSGVPTLLSGTVAARPAFLSSVPVKRFSIPVSIGPGATALTRTPDAAASSAADLVNPSIVGNESPSQGKYADGRTGTRLQKV